jgi:hypothetical protein
LDSNHGADSYTNACCCYKKKITDESTCGVMHNLYAELLSFGWYIDARMSERQTGAASRIGHQRVRTAKPVISATTPTGTTNSHDDTGYLVVWP